MNTYQRCLTKGSLYALAFWILASARLACAGEAEVAFDVPAGNLAESLQEVSRQAGVEILISIRIPETQSSLALEGEYSVDEAFRLLLGDSPWKAVAASGGSAFAIVEREEDLVADDEGEARVSNPEERKRGMDRFFRGLASTFSGKRGLWNAGGKAGSADDASVFLLSPFEVLADQDRGYEAVNTLSGTRLNSAVKDLGNTLSILTPQFWEDTAMTSVNEMILYTPGSERADTQRDRGNADLLFWGDTTIFRGIHTENIMRNQFRSNMPSDTYNAERFEFSRGPNAVLFGINRAPAGLVNRTTQDASLSNSGELKVRADDNGSWRYSANFNRMVLENRLGVRLAVLNDRHNSWIEQGYQDQDRYYLALNYKVNERLSLKVRYEDMEWERAAVDPTLAKDHVSAWVRAGRPAVDVSAEDDDVEFPEGVAGLSALNEYGYVNDGSGRMVNLRNFAAGDETLLLSGDIASVEEGMLPLELNHSGAFGSQVFDGDNFQFVAQYRVKPGLDLEYAANSEYMLYDFIAADESEVYVDANATLDDGVTPNPYFGDLFSLAEFNYRLKQDRYLRAHRLSASFSHDFGGSEDFSFLGRHKGALVLERNTDEFYWDVLRLINVTPPDGVEANDQDRTARVITYIDPLAKQFSGPVSALGFQDILNAVPGNDYQWLNGVVGGNSANRTEIDSLLFVWQGHLFDGRLIPTMGWRKDRIDQYDTAPLEVPRATAREQGYLYRPEVSGISPETANKGVVVEVIRDKGAFDYLSLFYNQADSFSASNFGRTPENRNNPPRLGETEDFGMRFGLGKGSLSGVFTVFEMQSKNELLESGLVTKTLLGDLFGMIGRHELNDIPAVNDTQDLVSEGWEFQLTANLLRGWRMMLAVDHFRTYDSNVAPNLRRLIADYGDQFIVDPDRIVPDQGTKTAGEIYEEMMNSLNLRLAQAGGFKNNERGNKATLLSTYEFRDGPLAGFSVGGSVVWRDKPSTGFPYREDAELGWVPDIENPFLGKELLNLNLHAAYKRRVFADRCDWKVQLNITNLGDEEPFAIRHSAAELNPRVPILQSMSKGNPQVVFLTNTLTF
ncbi:hypothetical protein [Pelagicoccus mobilis]|uniref:TonB-dependent receptor n=1 Tax=Pelagicoccus mobilis TaxID=415221 RepID=A0A934VPX9_9BACT|nr:hypothetical protein [Pelagicoccus mobilis]MBK1875959.1 hypothetical protein [Pelagicoccus mobilis]